MTLGVQARQGGRRVAVDVAGSGSRQQQQRGHEAHPPMVPEQRPVVWRVLRELRLAPASDRWGRRHLLTGNAHNDEDLYPAPPNHPDATGVQGLAVIAAWPAVISAAQLQPTVMAQTVLLCSSADKTSPVASSQTSATMAPDSSSV